MCLQVSVVLPDTPQVPHDITEALSTDNDYYKVIEISAHEFIEQAFINAFLKSGKFLSLSCSLGASDAPSLDVPYQP